MYLQLLDLALLVVLELFHVLLELLHLGIGCPLPLLCRLNVSLQSGDRLFGLLDILSNLIAQ